MNEHKVRTLTNILSNDHKDVCLKMVEYVCENVHQKNSDGENLLHTFVDDLYNEEGCLIAIKSLLELGVSPNGTDSNGCNFIATAIDTGYSVQFVVECIRESLKYGLKINHQDNDGDTIIHEAIYGDNFTNIGDLETLYKFVCDNGWKSSNVKNKKWETIVDAIRESKKYDIKSKERFIKRVDSKRGR